MIRWPVPYSSNSDQPVSGGYCEEETPVPIPNTEVKLLSADGTAPATGWESRSPPGFISEPLRFGGAFFLVLPEFAWMADIICGLARATYFTNGEIGTGNTEFSEPDEVNIFCLNSLHSAFRIPNSMVAQMSFASQVPPA